MSIVRFLDSPWSWAVSGFAIGLGLGVTAASVWLLTVGLGAFLVYMWIHGPAKHDTEGRLFAAAGMFITSWLIGFVVHGIAL